MRVFRYSQLAMLHVAFIVLAYQYVSVLASGSPYSELASVSYFVPLTLLPLAVTFLVAQELDHTNPRRNQMMVASLAPKIMQTANIGLLAIDGFILTVAAWLIYSGTDTEIGGLVSLMFAALIALQTVFGVRYVLEAFRLDEVMLKSYGQRMGHSG